MKILRRSILTLSMMALLLSSSDVAFSQNSYQTTGPSNSYSTTNGQPSGTQVQIDLTRQNPFRYTDVQSFIGALLDLLVKIGTIIALLAIMYSGFLFVTAGGDKTKISAAKSVFLTTVIGVAIILGAKAILVLLQGTAKNVVGF